MDRDMTVVISGAGGCIGIAILHRLCEMGIHVAILGSSQEKAEHTLQKLSDGMENALAFVCDVTDANAVSRALSRINQAFGRIDAVLALQGWPPDRKPFDSVTDETWKGMLTSHILGSYHLLCEALPYLRKSTCPRVILLSSESVFTGNQSEGIAYTTAKAGLTAITNAAAQALAGEKIVVACITTGDVVNVNDTALPHGGELLRHAVNVVLRLLDDDSTSLNGEIIRIRNVVEP